ncbi:MAG: DNA primase, partial [Gammaproteobacteria bacterium]
MSGRIPQTFIDDILARTDLVELIESRVPLKKAGTNYKACCPFHNEKTASFNVNGQKQFYHCFGCGASGNAISFMMEYDRLDFPDAVDELAGRLGLEVPREASNMPQVSKSLYEIMQQSSDFYASQLNRSQTARQYLSSRGLNQAVSDQYHIGFAPDAWSGLMDHIGRGKDTVEQLIDVGMVVKNDKGKTYDRFRNRLMFPIRNKRGKVIAFGGRIIGDGQPKYLNSPETDIFSKGTELYGLYEAKQANRTLNRLIIVEGYMEVVALAQFGITYAVATLGTATTDFHLKELFKQTNEVIFCFDGDKAGRDAAWKALNISLPHIRGDRLVRFMFLPQGDDPDTRVRAIGKEAFEQDLDSSYS